MIANNLFYKLAKAPMSSVRPLNAFIRVFNVIGAVKEKNLPRFVCEVAAFSALFFPHGLVISIAIDCVSELENIYTSSTPLTLDKKTMTRERALSLLKLTEDRVKEDLDSKYEDVRQALETRKAEVPPFFASQLALMLANAKLAYDVLKGDPNTGSN